MYCICRVFFFVFSLQRKRSSCGTKKVTGQTITHIVVELDVNMVIQVLLYYIYTLVLCFCNSKYIQSPT